jgi:hypothetical protein
MALSLRQTALVSAAALAASLAGAPTGAAQGDATARIGPSFDCAAVHTPTTQLICGSAEMSRADLEFVQAYYALRQQVGAAGWPALRDEDLDFLNRIRAECGIPESGDLPPDTSGMAACLQRGYGRQRAAWLSRLVGSAAEEARRPIEEHLALQRDLQQLGFLPPTAAVDGVYGAATRAAIVAWQRSKGLPETGFLGAHDGDVLAEAAGGNTAVADQNTETEGSAAAHQIGLESSREPTSVSDWYNSTRNGDCVHPELFPSPAALVGWDRENGLEDDVLVLKRDGSGKSLVVRVGEPKGNLMEGVFMFFRGKNECETYLRNRQKQIEDLK